MQAIGLYCPFWKQREPNMPPYLDSMANWPLGSRAEELLISVSSIQLANNVLTNVHCNLMARTMTRVQPSWTRWNFFQANSNTRIDTALKRTFEATGYESLYGPGNSISLRPSSGNAHLPSRYTSVGESSPLFRPAVLTRRFH